MASEAEDRIWLEGKMGRRGRVLLGLYTIGLPVVLMLVVLGLWPAAQATDKQPEAIVLWIKIPGVTSEQALMSVLALLGALGGALHALGSFAGFVGNRNLVRSWTWWYLARAPVGASLAMIVYFVLRGGLVMGTPPSNGGASSAPLNPYGLGAFAALAGLSSEIATQKLREVFEVLFRPKDEKKDQLGHSAPEVVALKPNTVASGSPDLTVVVSGKQFESADKVVLDGSELDTSHVSAEELRAVIPRAKLAATATLRVAVRRLGTKPVQSNAIDFRVT